MRSRQPLIVEVLRGGAVESSHQVLAVIADSRGLLHSFYGNHDFLTFPRSAIKLLQAIPLVESGAVEKFGLDDKMLALACASHAGEKQHLLVAGQWMEKLQAKEDLLHCGPAWPFHEPTKHEMIRKNLQPSRVLHNCSGKHLGIISTCLALGENPVGYHQWEHPSQKRLRKVLTELTRYEHERALWGVDGCAIPSYAVPLQAIAIGMAQALGAQAGEARKVALKRLIDAVRLHPQLVGGQGDFVSKAIEVTRGRVLVKSGAEGVYTAILAEKGLGIALKVHDGSKRAAEVALGALLRQLGGFNESDYLELKEFTMPSVTNSRGEVVGEIRLAKGSLG